MKDAIEPAREQELRQLAIDISEGKVFGSWMLQNEADLPLVFMVIALGGKLGDDVAVVYEYLDKAGPRSINGYPSFFSLRTLTKAEVEFINPLLAELRTQREQFLASAP